MDNTALESNIGNFLDKVDAAKSLINDKLTEAKLGTTATGLTGLLGAALQIDASLKKWTINGVRLHWFYQNRQQSWCTTIFNQKKVHIKFS